MEEATALAATVNDANLFGGLRAPGLQQDRTDLLTPPEEENDNSENPRSDVLELSSESLQLSLVEASEAEQRGVGGIGESDDNTESNPDSLLQNLTTPIGELLQEEQPAAGALLQEAQEAENATPPILATEPVTTGQTGGIITETPATGDLGVEVPNEVLTTTENTAEEGINPFAGGEVENLVIRPGETTSLEPEPETAENVGATGGQGPEIPSGDENTIETQAARLTDVNTAANTASGIPADTPATGADRAQQLGQSQEQLLLQNVGTQLAQTVPPASIISVLG
ncbi:MAG: hypothetical protein GY940_41915 [bacterium]|nr:hypothetical protein [bacterium]